MALVKISATITKLERSDEHVSSVVDTVSSVTTSSVSTWNTVELSRAIQERQLRWGSPMIQYTCIVSAILHLPSQGE